MANKYSSNPNERRRIKNTDNESTQYIGNGNSPEDYEDTSELRRFERQNVSNYSRSQQNYDNGNERPYSNTPGRQQYYGNQQNYSNQQYGNNQYQPNYNNNQQYGNNQYQPNYNNNQQYGNNQYQPNYNNQQYGNNQYQPNYNNNQQYGNNQYQPNYNNQQYGNNQYQPNYNNNQQYGNNQYQPNYNNNQQYGNNQNRQNPNQQYGRNSQNQQQSPRRQQQRNADIPPKNSNQRREPASAPPKPKKRHRNPLTRLLKTLLLILIIIFVIYSCIAIFLIKKMNYVEDGTRNSRNSAALSESYVTNILLIGTDGRTTDDRGRSDTMMLLSINSRTDEISLTSFMRDSYVDIPNYGWEKLNASYSYGGAELLMDTIEQNFSIKIDDYIAVNFTSFAAIIDAVGGIEIDVSDDEAGEINTILMAEVNELMGDERDSDLLSSGGKLLLDGKQALSYARIRYIGNADFERTERQRTVMTKVAEKLKSFNPSMISDIAKNSIPQITTNMSTQKLYLLSLRMPFILRYDIQQFQVPASGTYGSVTTASGGDALSVDFDANYDIISSEVFSAN